MQIEHDPVKRDLTPASRGLDMARAGEEFDGATLTSADASRAYGEERFVTVGPVDARMVIIIWTPHGIACRIVNLRKANARKQAADRPPLRPRHTW